MTVLLFLTIIIIFLGVDYVMQRKNKPAPVTYQTQHNHDPLRVPSGIFFAPSHTWLTLFPSGNVRIGIDDFVLRMMKDPKLVLLKRAGTTVRKGEPLLQIKEELRTITARSPIDAEVVELNDTVQAHPEALRESLFSDGWAYTIRPKKISDLTGLFLGEQSRAWIQREFGRLRDFVAGFTQDGSLAPALMQDGGMVVEGVFKSFSDEQCQQFEQQFLFVD
jgi:glycine cleavage system H lipoate-binding protein